MEEKLNTKSNEAEIFEQEFPAEEVFEMLVGYKDEEGNFHKEFEITEMTGADEEAIARAEIKSNGAKIIRTVLERCCTRIGKFTRSSVGPAKWREMIQSLLVGDQDFIMLKIREKSIGSELSGNHNCPKCNASLVTTIDIDELEIIPFKGQFEIEFELPRGYRDRNGVTHKFGKLRLPNGLDRELLDPVARKNIGEANTLLLTRCIVDLDGLKVTNDMIRNLSLKDREYLYTLLKDNTFGIKFEVDITCDSCGTEFTASLNMANFL